MLDSMHPEDVRAAIRKRFGTIQRFLEEKKLPPTGVADILRGRTSKRVRDAIEEVLADADESIELDDSKAAKSAHRLNRVAA